MNIDEQLKRVYSIALTGQFRKLGDTINTLRLSKRVRLEWLCRASIENKQQVAETILHNGYDHLEKPVDAALAREQIIQILTNEEVELPAFIVDLTIKNSNESSASSSNKCIDICANSGRFVTICLSTNGNKTIELRLLDRNADVNALFCGLSLLHNAVQSSDIRTVAFLLKHGANVNVERFGGGTPLLIAVQNGDVKIAAKLIQGGAKINAHIERKTKCHVLRETPMHWSLLHVAVSKGMKQMVELLLSKGAQLNILDSSSRTPLYFSARNGHTSIVSLLVQHGAQINCFDVNQQAPLHIFAEAGFAEGAEVLLQNGAEVDFVNVCGQTPLHVAARLGHAKTVDLLVKYGARIDLKDTEGMTPLMEAAYMGYSEVVKILLTPKASEGFLELHAREKNIYCNVNNCNNNGKSALYLASMRGHAQIVKILLEFGADVNHTDIHGDTALRVAVEQSFSEVVGLLLDYGADPEIEYRRSITALLTAVLANIGGFRKLSPKQPHIVRLLQDHGADIQLLAGPIGEGTISSLLLPIKFDPAALSSALEYRLVEDLSLVRSLHKKITDYDLNDNRNSQTGISAELILAQHVVKLQVAGWCEESLFTDLNNTVPRNFREMCETEVAMMKHEVIGDSCVTFYDLLFKSANRLAWLSRNETVVRAFESRSLDRFPLYGGILCGRFWRGHIRRRWIESACKVCHRLFRRVCQLPREVTENIVVRLSDRDLRRLVMAFKRHSICKGLEL